MRTHWHQCNMHRHYCDVIMGAMASQITSLTDSTVYSGADQRKHQSSVLLDLVRGIHRWPVNSLHKWPVTRKCFHLMTSSWAVNENEMVVVKDICYQLGGNPCKEQPISVADTLTLDKTVSIFVCCQPSNISRTLLGKNVVDHSDIVGAAT